MKYVDTISVSDFRSQGTCRSLIMTENIAIHFPQTVTINFTTGSPKSDNNGSTLNYSYFIMLKDHFTAGVARLNYLLTPWSRVLLRKLASFRS
jgi:hypothetical protein